jgi:hypothetical protein
MTSKKRANDAVGKKPKKYHGKLRIPLPFEKAVEGLLSVKMPTKKSSRK